MKKSLIILLTSCLATCVSTPQSYSQGLAFWSFSYDVSIPVGSTSDYISKASFRGFTMQGRGFINSNISLGGSVGLHVFNGRFSDPVDFDIEIGGTRLKGSVAGEQFRYINAFPILFNSHYYLGDPSVEKVTGFGGIGIGTAVINRRTEIGIVAVDDTNWHFALAPEVGVSIMLNEVYHFLGGFRYFQALKTNDAPSYSYLTLQFGFTAIF